MLQPISELALGSFISIYEIGDIRLYEIAGFDVHGEDTVTLVRKDIYLPGDVFDASPLFAYDGSNLDIVMRAFETKYTIQLRAILRNTSIIFAYTAPGTSGSVVRKVFALSYTELTGESNNGVNENAHLPLYSNDASRIKSGGSIQGWWTRSVADGGSSTFRRMVQRWDGNLSSNRHNLIEGLVPAFVIPSNTLVEDGVTEGGHLIFFGSTVPHKPNLIYPVNVYIEIDNDIVFEWEHVIDTGTPQSKANLQYSHEDAVWVDLITISGNGQQVTIPADTLPVGNLRWKVRTYNVDEVAGEWSDPASFVGVGAPVAPSITGVTASSRPTISWQSFGQVGYQLRILFGSTVIHDTGELAGIVKTHTLPFYLENEDYTFQLRILNAALLWSAWTVQGFTVDVTVPEAPALSVTLIGNGAKIEISGVDESIEHLYLLRNGIPVADVTRANDYYDYAALGDTQYVIRAVDSDENYVDSNSVRVDVTVSRAVLAAVDALNNFVTMSQKAAGQPAATRQKRLIGSSTHYTGREHPLHIFSEFADDTYTPAYYYTDMEEWAKLEQLVDRRQSVLYRDELGSKFYGVITSINHTRENEMIIFALTMQRVDYVEEIAYAEVGA